MANHPIQGTNADMTKWAMVQMERAFREKEWTDVGIVCQIHDELIVECPESLVDDVVVLMKRTMEDGLVWFGSSKVPNPMVLSTGCQVDYEVQKAWMIPVQKCTNCGRWAGEEPVDAEPNQHRCTRCDAEFVVGPRS